MEYQNGQMVYSKSGHDKGDVLVVVGVEGQYLQLADGKRRKLEKPKRKKIIHVQPTNYVDTNLRDKLEEQAYVLNADIAKAIRSYKQLAET